MDLTPEEKDFLKKYRRLKPRDQGYIDALAEKLAKDKKKRDFKICEKKEAEE